MTSSKGHILFINRVFPPDAGASGLRLMELCHGMAEKGWRVSVLTNQGRNITPANLNPNVTITRLSYGSTEKKPGAFKYALWLLAFFFRALFMPRADITVTLTDPPMSALITATLGIFKRTKTVHWVHDLYPDLFRVMGVAVPVLQPLLEGLSRSALNMHDAVVAIGDDMAGIINPHIKNKTKYPDKVAIIPNWPDVASAMLDKKKPARHDSKNPFVLEGVFTVLYSGNFGLVHDFNAIIDAIRIVYQSPHPIRFIFAGDGRKFSRVRNKIDKMMLTNTHFIRAQPRDKFMEMLVAGDLHLATMLPGSAGMVAPSKINSALGLGRPCIYIGSPKASQAKLIRDYDAGAVIDAGDPYAKFLIAQAIIDYASSPESYERAQQNALKAAESISYDKAMNSFDALFEKLLKKR